MLLVVASRADAAAASLVARWAVHGAAQLTPQDLSVPGWRFQPGGAGAANGTAVVSGHAIPADQIAGVLVRLPYVVEAEVPHIVPADRAYVAAEMTAFLLAWLSGLTCPVVNRPTPGCLAGPAWQRERWVREATRLGVPTKSAITPRGGACEVEPSGFAVTVVGGSCVGAIHPTLGDYARRLAARAGADLLRVWFSGPEPNDPLIGADPWPDVAEGRIADAVLAWLRRTAPPKDEEVRARHDPLVGPA